MLHKIYELIFKYNQYDIRYNQTNKTLYINTPMLVEDYVNMKNIIREYELDVENIILDGGTNNLRGERGKITIYPW